MSEKSDYEWAVQHQEEAIAEAMKLEPKPDLTCPFCKHKFWVSPIFAETTCPKCGRYLLIMRGKR